jgi:hypothetical protein
MPIGFILTLLTAGVTSRVYIHRHSARVLLNPLLHFQPLLFKALTGHRQSRLHLLCKQ